MKELCATSLTEVAALIQKKVVSPVELTEKVIERIATLDGGLHTYTTVTADFALGQARQAEREILQDLYRGPLHGIPIAVKDLIYTKDARTTCGSKVLSDWLPQYNATLMDKLYAAGAVLLGKLATTEFASLSYHPTVQPPINPWDPQRWPGASSSGSGVATLTGLCFGSVGTDTGGSIRYPAAACGVVGLKPTYGRVSRYGVFALAPSLDHAGPITRTVADAAAILEAIAGFDSEDPTTRREPVPDYLDSLSHGLEPLRLGVDESYLTEGVDPDITQAIFTAIRLLQDVGAKVKPVTLPLVDEAVAAWWVILSAECTATHEDLFASYGDDYGPGFRQILDGSAGVRGIDYAKAHVSRQLICRGIDDLFQEIDILVCPIMGVAPPSLEDLPPDGNIQPELVNMLLRFVAPMNLSGYPALVLPCGFNREGLPLAMQIVGRPGDEGTILQVGHVYEQATDWHKRQPPEVA